MVGGLLQGEVFELGEDGIGVVDRCFALGFQGDHLVIDQAQQQGSRLQAVVSNSAGCTQAPLVAGGRGVSAFGWIRGRGEPGKPGEVDQLLNVMRL